MTPALSVAAQLHQPPAPLNDAIRRQMTTADNAARRNSIFIRRTLFDGSPAEKVKAFRIIYNLPVPSQIGPLSMAEKILHRKLLTEELQEFSAAVDADDMAEQLDALLDLIYVAYGALLNTGLTPAQIDELFAEVHASNMTKVDNNGKAIYDHNGKVQKGKQYRRPDIAAMLALFIELGRK